MSKFRFIISTLLLLVCFQASALTINSPYRQPGYGSLDGDDSSELWNFSKDKKEPPPPPNELKRVEVIGYGNKIDSENKSVLGRLSGVQGHGSELPERDRPEKAEKPVANNNSNSDDCGGSSASPNSGAKTSSGAPVLLATGEKLYNDSDFISQEANGLSLGRSYRRTATNQIFGPGWYSSLEVPRLLFDIGCTTYWGVVVSCRPQGFAFKNPKGEERHFKAKFPLGAEYVLDDKPNTRIYATYNTPGWTVFD